MSQEVTQRQYSEVINARLAPSDKLALYRLAGKHGGLSGAVRYLIAKEVSGNSRMNDKSDVVGQDTSVALVTN